MLNAIVHASLDYRNIPAKYKRGSSSVYFPLFLNIQLDCCCRINNSFTALLFCCTIYCHVKTVVLSNYDLITY